MFVALSALANQSPILSGTQLDPNILQSRTARQIVGAIVEAVRPSDGTLDAEANRKAMTDAFAELLEKDSQADLMNLTDDQRLDVTEFFIGNDIFNRVWLDVGKAIQEKADSAELMLQRMTEMQQYIKNEVARVIRKERSNYQQWTANAVQALIQKVIFKTLSIFGDYHE